MIGAYLALPTCAVVLVGLLVAVFKNRMGTTYQ